MGGWGGWLVVWDKRSLVLLDKEVGPHSISCHFKNTIDGFIWVFTSIYSPLSSGERNLVWDELGAIRAYGRILGALGKILISSTFLVNIIDRAGEIGP